MVDQANEQTTGTKPMVEGRIQYPGPNLHKNQFLQDFCARLEHFQKNMTIVDI